MKIKENGKKMFENEKMMFVVGVIMSILVSSLIYYVCPYGWVKTIEWVSIIIMVGCLTFTLYGEENKNIDRAFDMNVCLTAFLPTAIATIGVGLNCPIEAIWNITIATAITAIATNIITLVAMAFSKHEQDKKPRLFVVLGATPKEAKDYAEIFVMSTYKLQKKSIVINERDSAIPEANASFWVLLIDNEVPKENAAEEKLNLIKDAKKKGYHILGINFSRKETFPSDLFDEMCFLPEKSNCQKPTMGK